MKLAVMIVTGSRSLESEGETHINRLWHVLDQWRSARERTGHECVVLHGQCEYGPDNWADDWAGQNGVHVMRLPALWVAYERSAGPRRNAVMAQLAATLQAGGAVVDAVAMWDGHSRGTKDAIKKLRAHGIDPVVLLPGVPYKENP